MARRYDQRTTTFSPEGRLYQVEYAMEAIGNCGTSLGIVAEDGIVIATERRSLHNLLDEAQSDKTYRLNDDILCAVSGITADANALIIELRLFAQQYQLNYGCPIPVEFLVSRVCDYKQFYTQAGGKRPFGVSFLYAGWDKQHGMQLYQSDPSGNFAGWKATCIGQNHSTALSILKQEYKPMKLNEIIDLAVKVMTKTLDVSKLTSEKLEIVMLTRRDGETIIRQLPEADLNKVIEKVDAEEKKKKAEAAAKK